MAGRIYNFGPGPAAIPEVVMDEVREALGDCGGTGLPITELSHRDPAFEAIAESAEQRVRRILGVTEAYAVLFLAGGATFQFAQAPMNLASNGRAGAYLVHGHWGRKAHAEAQRLGLGCLVASSEASGFDRIPPSRDWQLPATAAYLHLVSNETISGVQFHEWPQAEWPLVVDMSSDLFTRPLDVSDFGVVYASAQKNFGTAGLSLVLVRRDLLERCPEDLPGALSWRVQDQHASRYSTPPIFAWFLAERVLAWLEARGGLAAMSEEGAAKAALLYACIDASELYQNPIDAAQRSRVNVPFTLREPRLEAPFLNAAAEAGIRGIRGHKSVGGMRASIYNAMPEDGVRRLVTFMQDFEHRVA
ncbi:MAG: 3-phosphoserine/phosphohydroxythreonine transaminase [Xanthomonadales bacterium]|nr:3-phosphoserine/phosphohydroxythreonine transaminase [Xanthomonadales bacterium]NIN74877.1 3-phosphoserine/phosphohydroxythreonine transaminase [Xanthomonadales bacterium]NIO14961.1 3-phosphoserine/phosphohydroxythreonine transaminase [Xanthomonadales bacterium]NIP11904.1 3-phosphoserine/phosphohydroxythreonine transaminase [Xanthomonadales bacterium]NIP77202.1 3-phosphoserine/phosphohydroxythreonine transaminase [Xanthomonadales bacterium]